MSTELSVQVSSERRRGLPVGARTLVLLLLLLAGAGTPLVVASPAHADHGITTTGAVNIRSGPGTSYPVLGVVPAGVSPTYLCWERGENVGGVAVWFQVSYGTTGFISSYLDDSSYDTAEDITSKYGINPCTPASTTAVTPSAPEPAAPYSCRGPDSHASGYNGFAACEWATHNVSAPARFPTDDCTWFSSQALWEGGLSQTGDWTGASYDPRDLAAPNPTSDGYGFPGPTQTAAKAQMLVTYLVSSGLATQTPITWSDNTAAGAQIGDIIAYHWNPVGPGQDPDTSYVDHLAIITGFSGTYPLVSQHTEPQLNRGWSWSVLGNNWIEYAVTANDPTIVPQAWLIHIN